LQPHLKLFPLTPSTTSEDKAELKRLLNTVKTCVQDYANKPKRPRGGGEGEGRQMANWLDEQGEQLFTEE
jgi:hypothetical protein